MTVEELRRAIENQIAPEIRVPGFLTICSNVLSRIRAYGNRFDGWSFDFTKSAFNTEASYTTGTIAITQNTTAVTGSGTTWTDITLNRHKLRVGGVSYAIASIGGDTSITLSEAFAGADITGETYEIIRDEYALPSLVAVHAMWDATNDRKLKGISPTQMGDYEVIRDSDSDRAVYYSIVGRTSGNVHIAQIHPAPTAVARIEYWYQADYTRITGIGDTVDLPSIFDPVLTQGVLARTKQVLRMNDWRDEDGLFQQMLVDARFEDNPQRESKVRLVRTDLRQWDRIDLPAWHEVTV